MDLCESRPLPSSPCRKSCQGFSEDPESLRVLASGFLAFTHGVCLIAELSLPALLPLLPGLFGQGLRTYAPVASVFPSPSLQSSLQLSLEAFLLLPHVLHLCSFNKLS